MVQQLWNPNSPDVLGMEWRPVINSGGNLWRDGPQAQRMRSRSAETIEKLRWSVRGGTTTNQHMMLCDIYQTGQEIGQNGTTVKVVDYSPISDAFVGPSWRRRSDGLTTNLYQKINESPIAYPPVRTDFGIVTDAAHDEYRCRVGSSTFPLTSRVIKIAIRYIIASTGYEWRQTGCFINWAGTGPFQWNIPGGHLTTHLYGIVNEVDLGEVNPRTLAPWTPQDVRDFSITDGWQPAWRAVANTVAAVQLITAVVRVYYVDVEYRKAVGVWRRPAIDMSRPRAIDTDKLVTMPAGTANWAKASGIDYSFIHRYANDTLVQYTAPRSDDIVLDLMADPGPIPGGGSGPNGLQNNPVPGMAAALATVDNGIVQALNYQPEITGYNAEQVYALMMLKTGAVVSEDSQPYGCGWWLTSFANAVNTGLDEYQEVIPPSTQTYLGVDFNVQPPRQDVNQASTLTIQVRTTAGAAVGGSFTITAAAARALPWVWFDHVRVTGWLSSGAALTGATTYRITFSSNAPASDPWYIGTAGVNDSAYTALGTTPPNGDIATFQGTAGATYNGTIDAAIDLMVTLIKQPSPLSSNTARINTITGTSGQIYLYCTPAQIEVVDYVWAASAYTSFKRWRVQREEGDLPGIWVDLATITLEAQKSYRDYTARRTVPVRYRVRAELTSGAFTDWAISSQVIPQPTGAEFIFTSDADPTLTVAYNRDPKVTYEFLSAQEDTFVATAGEAYQKVFMTPTERGVRFAYNVTVNIVNEPDTDRKGLQAFDPLRRIARATSIPYVVVLDHEGQRFYAHIQMPTGVNEQPDHVYTTAVTITELTNTAVIIEQP